MLLNLVDGKVLIAEGENPVAIPILRSLARRGVSVAAMTNLRRSFSRLSKHCSRLFWVPSTAREKEYADAVEKIVRRTKFDALFPIFEWSLIPISKNRDRIGAYVRLPIASHEAISTCYDKFLTLNLAVDNGVPVPRTHFVCSFFELKKIAEEISYPAVVKPRWSMVWRGDKAFHRRSGFVNSAEELIATYHCIHRYFPFPLIQEYVPGTNYSVAALYNMGKPRAFCCIKVYRAWPPTGGNSCFRESVALDWRMKRYSERLLEALNWHGIAEVEFRLDSRDNVPKLMEINPRFWGSLCVAIKAGVDFPYLLYRIVMDGDVNGVSSYRIGVKGRYLEQELLYVFSVLLKGTARNRYIRGERALINWLKFYEPGIFYDLFDWDDPIPFLYSLILSPLGLIGFLRNRSYAWSEPGFRY
jgi:predicted ATP-grasp superfamily ATP-dependent carboligase